MKVLQFRPRDVAEPFNPSPDLDCSRPAQISHSEISLFDLSDNDRLGSCDAEEENAAPADLPVRKTIVTITRKKRTRKLSPVSVLARASEITSPGENPSSIGRSHLDRRLADRRAGNASAVGTEGSGGPDDFWRIWLQHKDYLRARSLRFSSGNTADAEDALSEAMLKAAQSFQSSIVQNHRAWLLRLVHNACMDRHRSNRRLNRLAKDITEADAVTAPAVAIQPDRSPEELLQAFEQIGSLKRAMNALPAFLADPLLRYLDEQSDTEIAGSLKVTKEVVRKRRQIARALLRRQMPV
ncbi:MAG: sigma-70 family RNA polymerase sigma factor [Rhizomicrobium sp.]